MEEKVELQICCSSHVVPVLTAISLANSELCTRLPHRVPNFGKATDNGKEKLRLVIFGMFA